MNRLLHSAIDLSVDKTLLPGTGATLPDLKSAGSGARIRMGGPEPTVSAFFAGLLCFLGFTLAVSTPAEARITRIEILRVESPTFGGLFFGDVGQYERLAARAFGEVDPSEPANRVITDITLAPRNARGKVEYSTDLYILRPVNRSAGNHKIFYEINNRGSDYSFGLFNSAPTSAVNVPATNVEAGNGFLMRQGYTIVFSGWDATVPAGAGRQTIEVPIARNADGSPIVGPSLGRDRRHVGAGRGSGSRNAWNPTQRFDR